MSCKSGFNSPYAHYKGKDLPKRNHGVAAPKRQPRKAYGVMEAQQSESEEGQGSNPCMPREG